MSKIREICGSIVNDARVRLIITVLIIANAVSMGMATSKIVRENEQVYQAFLTLDPCIFVIFTVEILLQLIYHGIYMWKDPWLSFDFVIVFSSYAMSNNIVVLRSLRICRSLRLIGRFETLRKILYIMCESLLMISYIFLLLLFVMYVYGVLFTTLFKDMYEQGQTSINYFSRLDLTIFTLFQLITQNDWGIIAREVMTVYPWAWMIFILYIMTADYLLINMIIGIFCDVSKEMSKVESCGFDLVQRLSDFSRLLNPRTKNETEHITEINEASLQSICENINVLMLQLTSIEELQKKSTKIAELHTEPKTGNGSESHTEKCADQKTMIIFQLSAYVNLLGL